MSEEQSTKKKRRPKRQRRERGRLHLTQDQRSGIFYITGTVRGSRVRESTGTSDAQAADALRVKRESELLNESIHGKKVTCTFAECVTHYLSVRDGGGSNARWLAPLVERFGDTLAKDINTQLVHAYANEQTKLSAVSKNTCIVNPVISVLRCAAGAGMCDLPVIQRYKGESPKVLGSGEAWITEFLSKSTSTKLKAWVMLVTTTGARGVDARRLRTEHVNYEQKTAYLPQTKNGDDRTLELVEPLIALLTSFDHAPDGTVFGFSRTSVANKEIAKECKRIGMAYQSTHKFGRHAIAERLLNEGWTLKEVAEAVGWRDIVTLHKRYGHLEKSRVKDKLREAASIVARGTLRVVNGGK
jgi:hypothetical protein